MKRRELLRHVEAHGCRLLREGHRHTIYWNQATNRTSSIPHHVEVHDFLARKICRDLAIPEP